MRVKLARDLRLYTMRSSAIRKKSLHNAGLSTRMTKIGHAALSRLASRRRVLQQFAMGQQHSQFLTAERLHMHRAIKSRPHHLRHAARIVAVGLVDRPLLLFSCLSGVALRTGRSGWTSGTNKPFFPFFPFYPGTASFPRA